MEALHLLGNPSSAASFPYASPEKPERKVSLATEDSWSSLRSPERLGQRLSAVSTDHSSRSSIPWTSPEKRGGTGRFHPEELTCFRRLPTPSPLCAQKAESYWQSQGGLRRVFSDSGLHILPVTKGHFWMAGSGEPSSNDTESDAGCMPRLPLEDQTAMVLDQIFPKSSEPDALERETARHNTDRDKMSTTMKKQNAACSMHEASTGNLGRKLGMSPQSRQARFMFFRHNLLDKFSTIKNAFDIFTRECGDYKKELSCKEFMRFLGRHFDGLSREEQENIFEFLDADKNGAVSLSEFHIAVEAAAPVRNMDDLRRRWIALGFPSMRQALAIMENSLEKSNFVDPSCKRLVFAEFVAALCQVGIMEDEEHHALFAALTDATGASTVSLDELTSALASVSPALLLEDVRDRILKIFGSIHNAYKALDIDDDCKLTCHEFAKRAASEFRMSGHEATKTFQLIDIDGSRWISRTEFVTAFRLSEPSLFLEEVRRKVRQRFRSIRDAFMSGEQDAENVAHGDDIEHNSTRSFRRRPVTPKEIESKTATEFNSVLSALQLSESETQMLFDLIDLNGDGKLTALEFVRGIQLLAPSCVLEDLRSRCLARHVCVRDAFPEGPSMSPNHHAHRGDVIYDKKRFRKLLEALDFAFGINVDAVFDLVESRHDGGLHINELIVALQSAAPGVQVPLPPDLRDARARQQVRWQLAPFHRSASELRHQMRRKFDGCDGSTHRRPLESKENPVANIGYSPDSRACGSASMMLQRKNSKSSPALASASPPRMLHSSPLGTGTTSPVRCGSPNDINLVRSSSKIPRLAHQPTKRSYKKVTQLLQSLPSNDVFQVDDREPILDRIHDYYKCAGDTMAHDWHLLKRQWAMTESPQRRMLQTEKPRLAAGGTSTRN